MMTSNTSSLLEVDVEAVEVPTFVVIVDTSVITGCIEGCVSECSDDEVPTLPEYC